MGHKRIRIWADFRPVLYTRDGTDTEVLHTPGEKVEPSFLSEYDPSKPRGADRSSPVHLLSRPANNVVMLER